MLCLDFDALAAERLQGIFCKRLVEHGQDLPGHAVDGDLHKIRQFRIYLLE